MKYLEVYAMHIKRFLEVCYTVNNYFFNESIVLYMCLCNKYSIQLLVEFLVKKMDN